MMYDGTTIMVSVRFSFLIFSFPTVFSRWCIHFDGRTRRRAHPKLSSVQSGGGFRRLLISTSSNWFFFRLIDNFQTPVLMYCPFKLIVLYLPYSLSAVSTIVLDVLYYGEYLDSVLFGIPIPRMMSEAFGFMRINAVQKVISATFELCSPFLTLLIFFFLQLHYWHNLFRSSLA